MPRCFTMSSFCFVLMGDPLVAETSHCVRVSLRLAALVKDYCGSVSEKSVQMNFALIYELLDEMVVSRSECSLTSNSRCQQDDVMFLCDGGGGGMMSWFDVFGTFEMLNQ